ncbi:MAG: membrane or secreted protein [Flavobacteriales bacterium]|nr:membrane or secreted protein [Flavobacteriales bacterium]
MNFLSLFIISIICMSLVFIGIGIKIILKKNGKFAGTCASANPLINNEGETCGYCGKKPSDCDQN